MGAYDDSVSQDKWEDTVNAHKLAATLEEDGTLVLRGLPFHAGDEVEIVILERPKAQFSSHAELHDYPLHRKQPYRYDDPFEPAVSPEEWEEVQ